MVKKGKKKRKTSKKIRHSRVIKIPKSPPVTINMPNPQQPAVNNMMMENFVSLQRVLTNLSGKIDNLTTQLSKLLDLFEISAKSLAEREFEIERDNKDTLEKLNILLDQNKILARGLSLMHERMPMEQFPHPSPQPMQQQIPSSQYMREIPQPFQSPQLNFQSQSPKKPLAKEMQETNSLGMPSIMSNPPPRPEEQPRYNSPKSDSESEVQETQDFDSFVE